MKKMKAFFKWAGDMLDDVAAYLLTIAGILLSNYIPLMKTGAPFKIDLGVGRLVVAAVIALLIIGRQEAIPADADAALSRAGRRRNIINRMVNALAQGLAWAQIAQLAG